MVWLRGVKRQVSLLLANGHPEAWHYPIGFLYEQASFVAERLDAVEANRATMLQSAISTVLGGEKARTNFKNNVKDLLSYEPVT